MRKLIAITLIGITSIVCAGSASATNTDVLLVNYHSCNATGEACVTVN